MLDGATFRLDRREKVALVGRNGTGKTTLLKIVTGLMESDAGSVNLARGAKVGYLRQDLPVQLGRTVLEEAQSATADRIAMRARLEALEAKLEAGATDEDLEEYALLHEHFLEAEGYSLERDIRVVLQRMGFEESEFDKRTDSLSGGERTRLALARMLLEEPDLLILDEPTNHLDLQATEWLESWIRGYHGAILLVSHDRTFLENTAERVLELREGKVKSYDGNYAAFLKLREEDEARQAEVARQQSRQIAKLDEYVRRFMNSQRTAQARGRLKQLDKLVESRVIAPKSDRGMAAGFGKISRSGTIVLETKGLGLQFTDAEKPLFTGVDWTVRFGERWGIIGENGAGKSTLVRVALGQQEATAGSAKLGAAVVFGYFRQDGEDLDPDETPLDFLVWECDMQPPDARNLLGRFLIEGDDALRPIKTLSGGERNKLSLARLTQLNPNLLVLDEPTNHLDIDSREALIEVLRSYKGTLVVVSHDRRLLAQVTDHILDLRRSGPIFYPGSYSDYRRKHVSVQPTQRSDKGTMQPVPTPALSPREISKELERLARLEDSQLQQVGEAEKSLAQVELRLASIGPKDDVTSLSKEHARLQIELREEVARWEATTAQIEELERQKRGLSPGASAR